MLTDGEAIIAFSAGPPCMCLLWLKSQPQQFLPVSLLGKTGKTVRSRRLTTAMRKSNLNSMLLTIINQKNRIIALCNPVYHHSRRVVRTG